MNDKDKKPNLNFIWFYAVLLGVILLFNTILIPNVEKNRVTQVGYGTFIQMLEKKEVDTVTVLDKKIKFTPKKDSKKVYVTGAMDDPDLVKTLNASGAKYSKEVPMENSPILNFLLTWVLPFLIFWMLGRYLLNSMGKRMGGSGGIM